MEHFEVVWRADPDTASATNTARFMACHDISNLEELHARSVENPEWFWWEVARFLGLPFDKEPTTIRDTSRGPEWATWFVGGRFNLSRACVDRWAEEAPERVAVKSFRESGDVAVTTFSELADLVSRLAGALTSLGVRRGDAVAVFLPMSLEAVAAMLGTARIGAIFIPVFSGYGAEAVATRLVDPVPKVLVCANAYERRGRPIAMKPTADEAARIAGVSPAMLVVDYLSGHETPMSEGRDHWWHDMVPEAQPQAPVATWSEDPVMIAYTSGTTGRPKGAVHVQAGLTVKLAVEGAFQMEVRTGDTLMWVTDMGWIMGPWTVVAGLANGAAIATYDGAPDYPKPDRIWEVASGLGVTHLGISPTLIRALQPHGAELARKHDLSRLRAFGSTGEPWNPEPWWWLFRDVGEERIPIVNISGGTEIGACILSVNLLQGIKPTSLGGPALGIDADVYDSSGNSVRGEVGELVIRGSWPAMTRGFWGEPDRYLEAYWSRIPGTWVHGDWASVDSDGFWYLHGRSDDTLNVGGKRLGPAEFESAAVALEEITMAAAVGVPDPVKGEAVRLFVVPAPGVEPDSDLETRVADAVIAALGKAFRPQSVTFVPDLPRTRSQKIMRRVIRAAALGDDPGDVSSLENPESLRWLSES